MPGLRRQPEGDARDAEVVSGEAGVRFSLHRSGDDRVFARAPTTDHGRAFDKAFGLTDVFEAKARLIEGAPPFPAAFQDFPKHEATAHDLYVYEHSVFPGLIQTEHYARAVFWTLPNVTDAQVERLVAGRLARQEVLFADGREHPRLWALVDEAALRRPVDGPEAMYEQCMRALEVSRLPHVSLAVLPYTAGAHIGLSGACTIIEVDGTPRMVNLDDLADGRVTEDPVLVRRVALRFRSLQHEALPGAASRDMITRIAEELWNGKAPDGARAHTALPMAGNV